MNINTELSLDASNFCPAFTLEIPATWFTLPALKHAMISDFWQMGKGHGSPRRKEAEVNINRGRRGNAEGDLWDQSCSYLFMLLACFDISMM